MKTFARRAFSLVEILVVLAIVGILAALLLPVLSRMRQQGERTACASNLKQLASAMQIYLQDSGGVFPIARSSVLKNGVSQSWLWSDRVETAVPIRSLLRCPSVPASAFWDAKDTRYQLGRDVSTDARPNGAPSRLRFLAEIDQPALTELFTESNVTDNGTLLTGRRIPTQNCGPQPIFNLHLDGANIAYLDGHVKWMSADAQAAREEVCGW